MPATALVTSEQYLALPDQFDQNGNRIKDELIGGEIVRMPTPSQLHDLIKSEISLKLSQFLLANTNLRLKSVVEMGVRVNQLNVLVPDVTVIRRDRINLAARIFEGAPDLAVEVVSPTDTASHLKTKVDAYLANGCHSVWVVYPESKSVISYSVDSMHEFRADEAIEDPLLPGFSVPVSAFFELS